MDELFGFGDELGPLEIIRVREPSLELQAILVVDNLALGPALCSIVKCWRSLR